MQMLIQSLVVVLIGQNAVLLFQVETMLRGESACLRWVAIGSGAVVLKSAVDDGWMQRKRGLLVRWLVAMVWF